MIKYIYRVYWGKHIRKVLDRLPKNVRGKFYSWVMLIELDGLEEAQKRPGFHDEPLKGQRQGQRSVRLNQGYRVIYELSEIGTVKIIEVKEVTKHEY